MEAGEAMTPRPVRVHPGARAQEALRPMEERPCQIPAPPAIDAESGRCAGLVRMPDIRQRRTP